MGSSISEGSNNRGGICKTTRYFRHRLTEQTENDRQTIGEVNLCERTYETRKTTVVT